jgi:N-methylhydantoinase A
MKADEGNRLAVDIGGTFTDLVLEWGGQRFCDKLLTTHPDPALGVMQGIQQLLNTSGAKPADIHLLLHGTTLATNALIERRGAVTALLTTAGHRDVLEMASENRFEQYDVNIDRPLPLVPRHLRLPIVERLNAQGEVLVPLAEDSVHACLPALRAAQVTSVAIGLLHAYANPAHEQQVAEILRAQLPQVSLTTSSGVCPEIREYERFSTACANAYVKPLMARYLGDLQQALQGLGFACPMLLMTSGGGLTTLAAAREFPIRLVESGPAGGAMLAAQLAAEHGNDAVLSFDMGGTTAKLCLIDQGQPLVSRAFEVDRSYRFKKGSGLPIRIPVVEMVEIGAGGGSVAAVDALQRIQVGPQSAGSEPGPACYGRGGEQATVTDADLVLGKIGEAEFAGGTMRLDRAAAAQVLTLQIAQQLGQKLDQQVGQPMALEPLTAAVGISETVDENMAAASRAHAAEWGKGVSERLLVAFGGAAPLHAARLAQILRIQQVLVPANAGVGSAIGFLLAPVRYEVVRSRYMRLSEFDVAIVGELIREMRTEAHQVIDVAAGDAALVETCNAYMRYQGQGYEIAVPLDPQDLAAAAPQVILEEAFAAAYAALYGRVIPGQEVEILSWTLSLGVAVAKAAALGAPVQIKEVSPDAETNQNLVVTIPGAQHGQVQSAPLVQRASLNVGDRLLGPVLVAEPHTTTVVPLGAAVVVQRDGALLINIDAIGDN